MYSQTGNKYARHFHHWRNHEKIEELEQILDSDFSRYIDPGMTENIKSLIRMDRKHQPPS
ncbi:MAG: hypothetical protein C0623_07375 [Desulfuromonas sp.]|nr:MAG: hypothetical protein C0623_07375 [Desulfuromonas sp.]